MPLLRSVMTPFPYAIESRTTVEKARDLMVEHGIRHLPVVEGTRLVGVVSDRDLKWAMDPALDLPPRSALEVQDIMSTDVYAVDLNERLDRVLAHLARRHIGCAIVLKEGQVTGIFTTTDACRSYAELLRRLAPAQPGDDVA